jgi:hypothetical protein
MRNKPIKTGKELAGRNRNGFFVAGAESLPRHPRSWRLCRASVEQVAEPPRRGTGAEPRYQKIYPMTADRSISIS